MSLSVTSQWTLVASGLMAHADRVMSGEECERLMALVDEEIDAATDGDDYAHWLAVVSDAQRLEAALEQLPPPPADRHRAILETAWLMAAVDGERAPSELAALERLAVRLGVEPPQLASWREAWTQAQEAHAELATAALAFVLGGGGAVDGADARRVEAFVHGLPTTHEHRAALASTGMGAQALDGLERRLRALGEAQRRDVLRRVAAASEDASEGDDVARERWQALGRAAGLSADELSALADA